MKNFNKGLILYILLVSTVFACSDDNNDTRVKDTVYNYDVTLSGANEVPSNGSAATGKFVGTYTKSTRVLAFTLTYSGITVTDWHLHAGAPSVSGPVRIDLKPVVSSPLQKSITLTADEEADLLSGNLYVNIHSAAFPLGEIRAQLAAPVVVETEKPAGGGY